MWIMRDSSTVSDARRSRRPKTLQRHVYEIMQSPFDASVGSRIFDSILLLVIAINVVAVMLETVQGWSAAYWHVFRAIEVVSILLFTIEYATRVWSCTSDRRYAHPFYGRLRFMLTPMAVLDLLAIVPYYLPMLISVDLRMVRVLRLLRLFRMLKIARFSRSLQTLENVLRSRREELLVILFTLGIMLALISALMYAAEHDAQPEKFSSIPASMWWGIVTLTTIGYGDIYPVTPLGKTMGAFIAVLGVALFALPAGLLGSAFVEELHKSRRIDRCPHCGKPLGSISGAGEPPSPTSSLDHGTGAPDRR
jgi:voltage-gated potassium channel